MKANFAKGSLCTNTLPVRWSSYFNAVNPTLRVGKYLINGTVSDN
jgi:hypothetical protein